MKYISRNVYISLVLTGLFLLVFGGVLNSIYKETETQIPVLVVSDSSVVLENSVSSVVEKKIEYISPVIEKIPEGVSDKPGTPLPNLGIFYFGENPSGVISYFSAGRIINGEYKGERRIAAVLKEMGEYVYFFVALPDNTYVYLKSTPQDDGLLEYRNKKLVVGEIMNPEILPSSIGVGNGFSLSYNAAELYGGSVFLTYPAGYKLSRVSYPSNTYSVFVGTRNNSTITDFVKDDSLHYFKNNDVFFIKDEQGIYYSYLLRVSSSTKDFFGFDKDELILKDDSYGAYGAGLPTRCGTYYHSPQSVNLSDTDFHSIGSWKSGLLYELTNGDHPLYSQAYQFKFTDGQSLEGYKKRHPLLFIKDPWGDFRVLIEKDYVTPGGCGKPVLYFYPEKTTDISVSFVRPMDLTIDIPKYSNGWKIKANPDGTLVDLQPEETDCASIDTKHTGSEYAQEACLKNRYPYLYWAGNAHFGTYPDPKNGWIVDRSEVSHFLDEKLDYIGLTPKEKEDMLSYWIPEMLKHNALYYRISLIQTSDLNEFIPMKINPKPLHYNRIFLDYIPLTKKPEFEIPLPKLERWNRDGYTVTEWGGLKR